MSLQYIFYLYHPEVVSLTKSHRKTQSPCVLLEFGVFLNLLHHCGQVSGRVRKIPKSSPLKMLKYMHLANIC